MNLSALDQRRFPLSTKYIKQVLPQVANNVTIRRAMARFGQLNLLAFRQALRWGTDPLIVPQLHLAACASFSGTQPNQITLRESIFTDFEAGRGRLHANSGTVPALGVNILHEMTHWGDFLDGTQQRNPDGTLFEEGHAFELAVYGRDLTC